MILVWHPRRSRLQKPGEDLVALPGQGKIFFGESAGIMRGERQFHLIKTNVYIRVVIHFLSALGDAMHKRDAHQKSFKLVGAADGLRAIRPIGNSCQVKADLFGSQGWHDSRSIRVSPGAAFFAAAGKFIHGGPGAGFRIFRADTFFLVAGFDMCRLTFLFVSVTGFIALRHEGFFLLGLPL